MKKLILFDFNRTIFDPEKRKLISGARMVLRTLYERGHILCLVAQAARSREDLIESLGIGTFFSEIILLNEKKKKDFEKIILSQGFLPEQTFVIGDRTKKEITIGNILGCQTVWVKSGKFSQEIPEHEYEQPLFTVKNLKEVLKIIH